MERQNLEGDKENSLANALLCSISLLWLAAMHCSVQLNFWQSLPLLTHKNVLLEKPSSCCFNVKMPSRSNKIATTNASVLLLLAEAIVYT